MIEEWREVEGFEGYYKVSNLGRVYSYARNIIRRLAKHKKNEQYLTLTLSKNGYKKDYQIHVLVFETFVRKIDKRKEVVHHIDGDPKNNTLENLKVMTRAEHNRLHKKDKQHPKRKKVSKDEFKMKKRDYDKKYYQKNKEIILKRLKEYYHAHKKVNE